MLTQAQQFGGVAKVDLACILFMQIEVFDRADAFTDEHRAFFGVERAIAGKNDVVWAKKIQATAQG